MREFWLVLFLFHVLLFSARASWFEKCKAGFESLVETACSFCKVYQPPSPIRTPLGRIEDTEGGLFRWMEDQVFVYQQMSYALRAEQERALYEFIAAIRGAEPQMSQKEAHAYWLAFTGVTRRERNEPPDIRSGALHSFGKVDTPLAVLQDDPIFRARLAKINDPTASDAEKLYAIRCMEILRQWDEFHSSIAVSIPSQYVPPTAVNIERLRRYREAMEQKD